MPKSRTQLYIVFRFGSDDAVPCEAYLTLDAAEEASGRYQQHFKDMNLTGFTFGVRTVTYYDE